MKNILFVCTGNTCRSPMAEGLANRLITADMVLSEHFHCFSAGISVFEPEPANQSAIEIMSQVFDTDIDNHISKQVSSNLIYESHLILTMTKIHSDFLSSQYPDNKNKIFTLKEYVHINNHENFENIYNFDILDPFGRGKNFYMSCATEINDCIKLLLQFLKLNP